MCIAMQPTVRASRQDHFDQLGCVAPAEPPPTTTQSNLKNLLIALLPFFEACSCFDTRITTVGIHPECAHHEPELYALAFKF
jgi:hypothetical protein